MFDPMLVLVLDERTHSTLESPSKLYLYEVGSSSMV
jgi:hypothetical protein